MNTSSKAELPRIVFVFPYHGVGGVSVLFLRIAEFLALNGMARVSVVDYADGFMARHLRARAVELLPYADDGRVRLPEGAVAVFQSMTPWSIFPSLEIPAGTRLLFWNCHPFNLVPTLPGAREWMQGSPRVGRLLLLTALRPYRAKILRLLSCVLPRGSLVFMDEPNVRTTQAYLATRIPAPTFLPIPCLVPPSVTKCGHLLPALRVGWVGRLVDFKFHVLHRALLELDAAQPRLGLPISVTIVGGGEFEGALREAAASLKHVSVSFLAHCDPARLDEYMAENFDLLLAMGTSALEGGKLGLPTLLLDFSYRPVPPDYRFRWLQDASGFSLGDMIENRHLGAAGSMADRLRELVATPAALGEAAFSYVRAHHSIDSVAVRLLACAARASCTWGDLTAARVTGRGVVYGAFAALRRAWRAE